MTERASDNRVSINIGEELRSALGLHQRRQLSQAQAIYEKILAIDPGQVDALHLLGVVAYQERQFGKAVTLIEKAIAASPANAVLYASRGVVLREMKQLEAAVADYDRAISLKPDYAEAYYNRGIVLRELGKLDAAIADYGQAIALKPDHAAAYNHRGFALHEQKKPDAAIADYTRAIALKPDYAESYINRGLAFQDLKRLDAAIADYEEAIALKPDYAEAYYHRGNAMREMKELGEAIAAFGKAIALKSDYTEAYNNRGNALQYLKQFEAAIVDYDRALAATPDYAEAYYNRGNARRELRQRDAAMADYDKAIALKPDYASAYWNKALISLLHADFRTGFELYEWRWKNPNLNMPPAPIARPLWLGDAPLREKRILLHGEQGLGDTIQFCRYAALAAREGAQVILAVPPTLVELLKSLAGVNRLLADGDPLPDFDYHCPLMSLPLAFKTDIDTIPSPTPYLHAEATKARAWKDRIGEQKQLQVGIVWSGGFRPDKPEVWSVNEKRNIRLDMFARALSEVDAEFFSLQKGDPAESEIRGRELEYWPRGNFRNFAADIHDFSDTAALVANLDLIVSVDTSTAHLAAALGKPTWILNRLDNDWRWLLDRDDSPWYASVKLYRQDESQRWEPVLRRVTADLRRCAEQHRAAIRRIVR